MAKALYSTYIKGHSFVPQTHSVPSHYFQSRILLLHLPIRSKMCQVTIGRGREVSYEFLKKQQQEPEFLGFAFLYIFLYHISSAKRQQDVTGIFYI